MKHGKVRRSAEKCDVRKKVEKCGNDFDKIIVKLKCHVVKSRGVTEHNSISPSGTEHVRFMAHAQNRGIKRRQFDGKSASYPPKLTTQLPLALRQ